MNNPESPPWSIVSGRLAFRLPGGRIFHPTAHAIWSSVFGNGVSVGGVSLRPSPAEALPSLAFSRFAATPALLLTGNLLQGIRVDVVVKTGDSIAPLPATEGGATADQVVVDGCWYPLESETATGALMALRPHGIVAGNTINLGQLIWLRGATDLPLEIIDRTETSPAAAAHAAGATEGPIPGITGQLYPYQTDGVSFLNLVSRQNLGCILGDEMGLGKTLQVIGLIQLERNACRAPTLVISPATLLENWRREFVQFAPGLSVLVHSGPHRAGDPTKFAGYDVMVTSYETAVRDEPLLSSIKWNVLVLDEAQSIKNPEAQRTASVKRLPRRVSVAVTGTPVENRLSDLWSLADFALPGLLGNLKDFGTEFDDTATDASRLAPVVAPILLRRRVSEVAKDLPPRIDIPQVVTMTRAMAEMYENVRREAENEYGAAAGLVSLQRLRMFCTHPQLINLWTGDPAALMPKYIRLLEILEEVFAGGEKALIFSSYTEMADILMTDLRRRFPGGHFNWIDGRVAVDERQSVVDRFSEFHGVGALVLNPKAAGVGLNITAANHVLHYNPEWNPAVEDQASARAYRRKQTRPVTVHHLYFADSVEEVVVGRLNFKRALADGAVTGHKGDATTEDIARALRISPISRIDSLE